jgi:hypothetical protein
VRSSPEAGVEVVVSASSGESWTDVAEVVESNPIGEAARRERFGAEAEVEVRAKIGGEGFDPGQSPVGAGVKPAEGGVSSRVGEKEAADTIAGRIGGEEEERVMPEGERIGGKGDAGMEGRNGSRMAWRIEAVGEGLGLRRPNFEDGEEEADRRGGVEFSEDAVLEGLVIEEERG